MSFASRALESSLNTPLFSFICAHSQLQCIEEADGDAAAGIAGMAKQRRLDAVPASAISELLSLVGVDEAWQMLSSLLSEGGPEAARDVGNVPSESSTGGRVRPNDGGLRERQPAERQGRPMRHTWADEL